MFGQLGGGGGPARHWNEHQPHRGLGFCSYNGVFLNFLCLLYCALLLHWTVVDDKILLVPVKIRAGVGSLSLSKNSKITFQLIVIQVVWKKLPCALFPVSDLSLALYSDHDGTFGPSWVSSESMCSYWLLYAALISNRWHCYKLIGCRNKWGAYDLKLVCGGSICRWHHQPSWVELRRTTL